MKKPVRIKQVWISMDPKSPIQMMVIRKLPDGKKEKSKDGRQK